MVLSTSCEKENIDYPLTAIKTQVKKLSNGETETFNMNEVKRKIISYYIASGKEFGIT